MKFLKKALVCASDDMSFKADFLLDITGKIPGHERLYVPAESKVSLNYHVSFEAREWGIKSMHITIPDQEVTLHVEKEDVDGNEEPVEIPFKVVKAKTLFILDMAEHEKSSLSVSPSEIKIEDGKVEVTFTL